MKLWIPVAVGGLVLFAYAYYYTISVTESEGVTSLGIANTVGLAGVFIALIAAGFILRRAKPHQ